MSAVFVSRVPINMHIRNGRYHLRKRIPKDLVDLFGRKEITKSLDTTDRRQAFSLNKNLEGKLDTLFHACKFNSVTTEVAKAHLKAILSGGNPPEPQSINEAPTITTKPQRRKGKRLSDAIDAYCEENENRWTKKTIKEFDGILSRILEGLKDPLLQSLERPTIVKYRDSLSAADKSVKTVNKYIQLLSTVLVHASTLKWINGNPAHKLGLKDNRRPDGIRRPFTSDECNAIFKALQRDKKAFYEEGKPERYWLPLLGMYTGARVNELAQLSISDIVLVPTINRTG